MQSGEKTSPTHPYETISVYELKERDTVKGVEYSCCFRDVITTKGDDILDIKFF
jgi:hypothetical protein